MINETYIILSLMYKQFIFRLLVGKKSNLFVMSFIEYIHWKSKFWQSPAQILAALLKVSTIIFKTITILIIRTTKLKIFQCSVSQTMPPQRKKGLFALVSGGAKSETSSYSPRGFRINATSHCQIRVAVHLNVVIACRLLLRTARFKYKFQSSLQRITIICVLHTGNKNIWEGDII